MAAHLGIPCVDRMLDSMQPGALDWWMAADELDNVLGHEYLSRVLELGFAGLCRAQGMPAKPEHFRPARPKRRAVQRDRGQEHAEAFAAVAATHNASIGVK